MPTPKPFQGIGGFNPRPLVLVSLSGGGFRAALYHAGVLRALHAAKVLDPARPDRIVFINAVSGGAIPALLWDAYGRSRVSDPLWPEKMVLNLVSSVPRFGGRFNWKVRGANSWREFLIEWWERRATGIRLTDYYGITTLIELLDHSTGKIHVGSGIDLLVPNKEAYKVGTNFEQFQITGATRESIVPLFMAAATAFPFYFKRWIVLTDKAGKRHEFMDAGLIDNLGAQPFMPFFRKETPAAWVIQDQSFWFISNAGARMAVPQSAAMAGWETDLGVDKLSLLDRIFRLTGDLAQPASERIITDLVSDHTNFRVTGCLIGTLPDPEAPWHCTAALPDQNAVANFPTALSRMNREDAICIMMQGFQAASSAIGLSEGTRESVRDELLTLRSA